ncbi:hypothetical protein STRIP9103_09359 [Streptomyces ipomoeae 91-03]|uniref:Uncharacterized protein n=1 Tax=Streptomyces ipomoeae 91-03 TaxID=698759 RepID=L1KJD2_9ACTN|nr:hypothetical protein STRIP9103_09359 [Streptomyces ipomoeae 91-03]
MWRNAKETCRSRARGERACRTERRHPPPGRAGDTVGGRVTAGTAEGVGTAPRTGGWWRIAGVDGGAAPARGTVVREGPAAATGAGWGIRRRRAWWSVAVRSAP